MNFKRWFGCYHEHKRAEYFRELMERHLRNSDFYQRQLLHAWKCNKQQTKGLQRQARKIKRLQNLLAELMVAVVKS